MLQQHSPQNYLKKVMNEPIEGRRNGNMCRKRKIITASVVACLKLYADVLIEEAAYDDEQVKMQHTRIE